MRVCLCLCERAPLANPQGEARVLSTMHTSGERRRRQSVVTQQNKVLAAWKSAGLPVRLHLGGICDKEVNEKFKIIK